MLPASPSARPAGGAVAASTLGPGQSLGLEIAGVGLTLKSVAPDLLMDVHAVVRPFLQPGARPDIAVTVDWMPEDMEAELLARGRLLFDSGQLWRMYERDGAVWFHFASPRFGPAAYKLARFERDFSTGTVYLLPRYVSGVARPLEYPLDELLWMQWLPAHRGIELHACGLRDEDGRGYLFVGVSGAGKTTTARLWLGARKVTVLSDDRIVVREEGGQLWMYGTPWHGEAELADIGRAPLSGVFLLTQAPACELRPLSPAVACTRLLGCSFVPFHDPTALAAATHLVADLTRHVVCRELRFAPDLSAVETVLGARPGL